jgi:hypothetical protein
MFPRADWSYRQAFRVTPSLNMIAEGLTANASKPATRRLVGRVIVAAIAATVISMAVYANFLLQENRRIGEEVQRTKEFPLHLQKVSANNYQTAELLNGLALLISAFMLAVHRRRAWTIFWFLVLVLPHAVFLLMKRMI